MSNAKSAREKIYQKYGVTRSTQATTTSEREQKKSSAPSTRTNESKEKELSTREKIYQKYGVTKGGVSSSTKKTESPTPYKGIQMRLPVETPAWESKADTIGNALGIKTINTQDAETQALVKRMEEARGRTTDEYYEKRYQEEFSRIKKEHEGDMVYPVAARADEIASKEVIAAKKEVEQIEEYLYGAKGGNKDSWFKGGAFDDGYEFGDATQTVFGTVGDLGVGVVKGVGRLAEGLVDLGTYGVGYVGKAFGADDFFEGAKATAQYSATDEWTKGITNKLDKYSVLGNKSDYIAEGIGQVGGIIATAGLGAAAGLGSAGVTALTTGVTGLSSMGSGMGEAYNSGATDGEALVYGVTTGAIEAGTELLFGGLGKGVNALGISRGIGGLDDIFAKKLSSKVAGAFANESVQRAVGNTIEYAIKSGGEGFEELLAGAGSAVMKKLTYMDDKELEELIKDENLLEQFVIGTVVSSIVQSPSYVKANKTGTDFITGQTLSQERDVEKVAEKAIAEREANGTNLTKAEKNKIYNDVISELSNTERSSEAPQTLEEAAMAVVEERNAAQTGKPAPASITPALQVVEELKKNGEKITAEDVKRESAYGDVGSKLLAEIVNTTEGKSYSQIKSETHTAYLSGYANENIEFTTPVQKEMYNAGMQDRITQDAAANVKAKSATVYDNGFTENEYSAKLSNSTRQMISIIAKDFGMSVEVVDKIIASKVNGKEYEANARHTDGKMDISSTAEKFMHSLVLHESGHRMEQFATDEWNTLANALYSRAERLGRKADLGGRQLMAFDDVKAEHDNAGLSMSTRGYVGEIAVRELETIFSSAEEFNNWRTEIESNQQVKSAWGKFMEWLSKLIENIKRTIAQAKMSKEARAEARKELAELEHIKELYTKAYLATKDAVADRVSDTKTSKNLEIKINEEYNGNINHSLKNTPEDNGAFDIDNVLDKSDYIGYVPIRKVKMKTFPPYNESKSDANERATRWAHREDVEVGAQTLIFYHNRCYVIGKYESADLKYQIDGRISYSAYESIRKELEEDARNRAKQFQKKVVDFLRERNERRNTDEGRGQNIDYSSVEHGRQDRYLLRLGREQDGKRDISSDISRSDEHNSKDRQVKSVNDGNSQFSLKDSEGKTLTKEQQEYFKDSKVRDEDGKLLVCYHGTYEDFTVFDISKTANANAFGKGHYFTNRKNDAQDNYASSNGADVHTKIEALAWVYFEEMGYTEADYESNDVVDEWNEAYDKAEEFYKNGKTVQAYLNIKNPVYAQGNELYDSNGNFVSARSAEYLKELGYDGIIDYGVSERFGHFQELDADTVHYVVFDSNQIKSTDNTNPTSNPDIRFNLKKPVEETKNLVAVHNMQTSELERTLDLGGLPMPSIAIIKAQSGHSEYGDVSLVFDKSVIDPKANKQNKVYGGDAWTPVYPTIEYKPNDKIAKKISDKYYELSRKYGYDESRPLYNYVYDLERKLNSNKGEAELINELYDNTDLMNLYLLDTGKSKVETVKKETRTELTDAEVEMNEYFINSLGADVIDEFKWDGNGAPFDYRKKYMSKYDGVIRETYKKLLSEVYQFSDEQVQNVLDSTKPVDYLKFVRDAYKYRQEGRVTIKTEDDYAATRKAIKDAAGEDYRKWVDSLFRGVVEKSGIRNNKDYYTNSGNPRSWEALHWENNLENVVKVMKGQDDVGGGTFFGGLGIWGVSAKDYRSIEEIKADSDRLKRLPKEEYDKIKESFGERLSEIAHSIMSKTERNPFIAADNAMECIVEAVRKSKTKSGILNNLKQYPQLTVTETTVDDIVSLVTDISNMPTEYFEAKPKRAVELNEIATAIIPDSTSEATKTRLGEMGIKYVEYEAGNEDARLEVLNSLEDVKFSLKKGNVTTSKDTKELLDTIEHLKKEFEVTKFAKADPKKLEKMTKDILKEYSSQADTAETIKAIDELYTYMANGEDGHSAAWNEVYDRAYGVAQGIIKNALELDDSAYQEYRHLREYLRSTPMKFDATYDNVPSSYENFNDFRKQNFGRLKFTKDGMSIDSVYQELAGLYPEFFDAEDQITTEEMLERIVDVLDELQPTEVNPYSREMEQASTYLANDIINRFFDIPQAKPTFADKAERRVTEERIKGYKKVEAVRQQKDEKIQKVIERQREKAKKQIDKVKQQRDTKVKAEQKKRKDAIAKMNENQKAKVLRAQIIRHTGELSNTLLKATDKKHIPDDLKIAVTVLLDNINLESNYTYDVESGSYKKNDKGLPTNKTKAFLALKEVYAQIAKNNDHGMIIASELYDTTESGVANIFDEVLKMSDKKIADMSYDELTTVYTAIRLIEHSIATANKMFAMQKWETLVETGRAFENSTATRRRKHALMKGHYLLDIETPLTFFSHFGEAGKELYRALRNAQDKEQRMLNELAELTRGIVSSEYVEKANKEKFEFVTTEGKKLTLSKAHILDLFLLYNREQGKKHILYDPESGYNGQGIHQPEIGRIRRDSDPTRLTKADLENMFAKLDAKDKEIANKHQELTLLLAQWGNEACMKVFGYEKFNDPHYWTVKSASEGTNQTIEHNREHPRSIKNMGSAKPTNEKAKNAVDIDGMFETFQKHASDMVCYSAWLEIMEDATRLYNYTFRDADGNKTTRKFQSMLDKYAGDGGADYYFNLLTDIQNGLSINPDTSMESLYTKLYGAAAKAKVAFKATVVAQQPMAIVRATTVMSPTYIMEAIGKGGINLPVWGVKKVANLVSKNDINTSEWYGGWRRALKYAPIAARKATGGYEIGSNTKGLAGVLYSPDTKIGKTKEALKESPLWAAGKADEITWGILWNACELETKKKTSLEAGSEAFYNAVAERFTEVIEETQVVDGVLQRSQLMRSSSGWVKPATTFKGEPTMALNAVMRAYDNLRYETNPAKRGKAIRGFSRATAVFLASAVLTAFARSLAVGLTGEDDDEYWKKVWKSFSGIQGDEEVWFDYVKNVGLMSDVVNNINPLAWLPIASELLSTLQGYDVERLDVASIADFGKAGTMFIESLDEEGKYTPAYATRNLLLKAAEFTGYSPYNLIRDIEGSIRTAKGETDDIKGLYDMEKWRTKPNANLSKYVDILYRAYKTDREAYEYIYDDLIENGADPKKIESQMETRMKKAEGVDKAPDLSKRYMSPDVEDKYDAKLKQIKKSDVWESANKDQKKNAEAALYDFLTSDSESMEKTREEAVALGIDETEYTLWQLAKEMAKDKGDGNEGFSKRERADAIQRLDLDSNTEWDLYLFNNEDDGASYARKQGVKSDTYANFIESLHKVDKPTKSGKYGSFTQEEAEAAIRKLKGLSQKEKAALWQSVNTKWKKNPFR